MRIDSPISNNASITGSFSGSFHGIGNFTGLTADSVEYANILNTPTGIISGSAAAARNQLGVVIGTDVQAHDNTLDTIAALTATDGAFIIGDGNDFVLESGATARTSLGLGSMAVKNSIDISSDTNLTAGTGLALTGDALTTEDAEINHDALLNFEANEHIDWTADQGGTNIHAGNYTDTNTTYTVGDGGLTQKNFTTALNTKLTGIEASADVTDTANVVGALTAGTNVQIAADGTISSTDTTTNTQLSTAQVRSKLSGAGAVSYNSTTGVITGTDTNTTYSVQDGELSQNNFTDTDHSKLDAIEASADVTDTANVKSSLNASLGGSATFGDSSDTITFPGSITVAGTTTTNNVAVIETSNGVVFEGTTADANETTLVAINPTADRSIKLPNASGTIALQDDIVTDNNQIANSAGYITSFTNTTYSIQDGELSQNNFTNADHSKLNAIEASADVTDTANVVSALTAGTNVAISAGGVISSTDTNTTYSVQDGQLSQNSFTNADHSKLNAIEDSANNYSFTLAGTDIDNGDEITLAGGLSFVGGALTQTDNNTTYSIQDGELSQNNFTNADHSKLNAIEASATADQTNAEIKAAVEAATDSNTFTDADHSKLNAIEASADVTDTVNVVSALTAGTNVQIAADGTISSTDTTTNTQLSTADVRGKISASGNAQYDSSTGVITSTDTNTQLSTADVRGKISASGNASYNSSTGVITSTDTNTQLSDSQVRSKLSAGTGISYNSTTGAITNTVTNTNTQLNNAQVRSAVEAASDSNVFTDTDHSKLNAIEASATADQSNAEIRAAVEAATDSNVFTDTDHSKLNAIEASADVTDTTNVKSALAASLGSATFGDANDTISIPGNLTIAGTTTTNNVAVIETSNGVVFEGTTADANETTLIAQNPTADRSIKLPNASGTLALTSDIITDNNQIANSSGYITSFTNTQLSTAEVRSKISASGNAQYNSSTGVITSTDTNTQLSDTYVIGLFSGGTNVSLASDGTISSTDTNTQLSTGDVRGKVSAGTGISYNSTTGVITNTVTNTNTQLSDAQIAAFGYIKTDTNTQLSTADVRGKVSAGTGISYNNSTGVITNTVTNTNTQLSDAQIAAFGYIKTDTNTQLSTADVRGKISASGNSSYNSSTGVITSTDTNTQLSTADVRGKISASGNSSYNSTTGVITSTDTNTQLSDTYVIGLFSGGTNVTLGSDGEISSTDTNTQLSTADVRGKFTAGTNVSITNGEISSTDTNTDTNTQRSDEEIRDLAAGQWIDGTNTTVVFDDAANTIKINSVDTNTDTNTQLTTAQVRGKISASGNASYNNSTGVITSTDTNTQLSDTYVIGLFSGGTNVSIAADGTISSTDTNTDTNDDVSVANLKTRLGSSFGSNAVSIGDSTDTVTIPGNLTVAGTTTTNNVSVIETSNGVVFEGSTADAHETTLVAINPTADRSIKLPNASGTLALTDDIITDNDQIANSAGYITSYTDTNTQLSTADVRGKISASGNSSYNSTTGVITSTDTNTQNDAAAIRTLIGSGNNGHVPTVGTAGHFLKHDGTFGLPSYTTNTNTQNSAANIRTKIGSGNNGHVPTVGTAGHFLKHDGTFGLPSYTTNTNTNTQNTAAEIRTKVGTGNSGVVPAIGTSGHFLKHDGTFGIPSYTTNTDTNTTYTAGAGLDLSAANAFSIEADLRDGLTHVGLDAGDYIQFSNNSWTRSVVNGTERLRVDTSGIDVSGRIVADSDITAYSDERLKKDIVTIDGALDKTKALRGVEFTRIADNSRSIGVVAQELEAILPELVLTDDEGMKSVNYAQITGLLIEAVKELSAKVEKLENK